MIGAKVHQPEGELLAFVDRIDSIVQRGGGEVVVTTAVASALEALIAHGYQVPAELSKPDPARYVLYPLWVDEHRRYSIAAAVWNVGQRTPIHDHQTWGVVGIVAGAERETRYARDGDGNVREGGTHVLRPGAVEVCCTSDDDIHLVAAEGDVPCVGIHIYGADIGSVKRQMFSVGSTETHWFVSHWASVRESPDIKHAQ